MINLLIFLFFAALTLGCAVLVIVQKNPMSSVLYLAFTVLSIAGVFFTLQADFIGAIQIMVYAGGIVVLYLFVIIIINLSNLKKEKIGFFPRFFLTIVPLLILAELGYIIWKHSVPLTPATTNSLSINLLGQELLTTYLIPFEVSSILLLGVLVGAIIVARKKVGHDAH